MASQRETRPGQPANMDNTTVRAIPEHEDDDDEDDAVKQIQHSNDADTSKSNSSSSVLTIPGIITNKIEFMYRVFISLFPAPALDNSFVS